jgi:tripartite-type tricarboxylate transporter receptor subunit TctC
MRDSTRRNLMLNRRLFVASIALTLLADSAVSADWPQRPVRILYPYSAGSTADGAARFLALRLGDAIGQPVIVENRVGANGTLAAQAVARAVPDGHTLFWATTPQIAISPVVTKVSYNPVKDFVPITTVLTNTWVLVINAQMPVRTVAEFVEYVRARPNKIVYAEGSIGSIGHLTMATFLRRAGLEMPNVTYQGNAPALNDVMAGHVPTMFSVLGDALPHATSNNIRLLAVSSEKRSPQLPQMPTIAESGFPGFRASAWNGLMAPVGTPHEIIERIAREVGRITMDQAFAERLGKAGVETAGSTPAEFAALVAADIALWADAVKLAGIGIR